MSTSTEELLTGLDAPDPGKRVRAVIEAARTLDVAWIKRLERMSQQDPAPEVRAMASECVGWMNDRLGHAGEARRPALTAEQAILRLTEGPAHERVAVIDHLATITAPWALATLRQALAAEEASHVAAHLIGALGARGDTTDIPRLARYLTHADPRLRRRAVEALGAMGHSKAILALTRCLEDSHPEVKGAAVMALRHANPVQARDAVDEMLSGTSPEQAAGALLAVAQLGPEFALPRLEKGLQDGRSEVRAAAVASIRFLVSQGNDVALSILRRDLGGGDPPPEGGGPSYPLASLPGGDPAAGLDHDDFRVRIHAALEIRHVGGADSYRLVAARVHKEHDPFVLASLLSAFGPDTPPELAKVVELHLKHSEPRVRSSAVEALGRIDARRFRSRIEPFLGDPHNRIQANAVVALWGQDGIDGARILAEMAAGPPARARSAAWAAGVVGDPGLVDMLEALVRDPDPTVRQRAHTSLRTMSDRVQSARDAVCRAEVHLASEDALLGAIEDPERALSTYDEELAFKLDSPDPSERAQALREVAQRGDRRYLESIHRALSSDHVMVRYHARKALGRVLTGSGRRATTASDPAVTPFASRLCFPEEHVRTRAALEAAALAATVGPAAILDLVLGQLAIEESPVVRSALVNQVGLLGDPTAASLLVPFLGDPDPRVRANTVEALDHLGETSSLMKCLALLADRDNRVRANVLSAMKSIDPEALGARVGEMLASPEVWDRASASHVLIHTSFPGREDLVRKVLSDEPEEEVYGRLLDQIVARRMTEWVSVLVGIHGALAPSGKKRRMAAALDVLSGQRPTVPAGEPVADERQRAIDDLLDPDPDVRKAAIGALASHKDPGALPYVRRLALADLDPLVRSHARSAVRALEPLPPLSLGVRETLTAVLPQLLDRQEPRVRIAALRRALWECPSVLLGLSPRAIEERDPWVQWTWAEVLAELGDPQAQDTCRVLLTRDDARVRAPALAALEAMRDPQAPDLAWRALDDSDPLVRQTAMRLLASLQAGPLLEHLGLRAAGPDAAMAREATACMAQVAEDRAASTALRALLARGADDVGHTLAAIVQRRGRPELFCDLIAAVRAGRLHENLGLWLVRSIAQREGVSVPDIGPAGASVSGRDLLSTRVGIPPDPRPPIHRRIIVGAAAALLVICALVALGAVATRRR